MTTIWNLSKEMATSPQHSTTWPYSIITPHWRIIHIARTHSHDTFNQSRAFNHFIVHTLDEQFLNEKHAFWPSGYKDCRSSLQWCVHRSPLSEESLADRRSEGNLKTCRGTFNGKRRGSDTTWSNNRCQWEGWWSLKFRRTENQKSGFSIGGSPKPWLGWFGATPMT